MNTLATLAACFVCVAATSSIAHAETPKFSAGAAVGPVAQNSGFLLIEEHAAMVETQLHAGYHLGSWIEPGVEIELASGSGLRSVAAIGDVRAHLFPMLPVNPTVVLGAGMIDEHGTDVGDDSSQFRLALVAGGGLEAHIGQWTASLDVRFMVVRGDDEMTFLSSNRHNTFAHDAIFAGTGKLGLSRNF